MVFANLTMISKDPNLFLQFMVAGHHGAGLSECAEILSGIEAKAAGVAERAGPASFVFGSMSLGGVFDDDQTAGTRDLAESDPCLPADRKGGRE